VKNDSLLTDWLIIMATTHNHKDGIKHRQNHDIHGDHEFIIFLLVWMITYLITQKFYY